MHPSLRLTAYAVATALAFAGPVAPTSAADPDLAGTYAFSAEDGESATWTLAPCGDNAPGCVRVSESGNPKRAPWSADAHFSVGSWILFVQQGDAILCEDGSSAPGVNTYSWDSAGLAGSASILTNGACGGEPKSLSIPFTLTRVGPGAPTVPVAPAELPPAAPAPAAAPLAPPAPQPPAPAPMPAGPLEAEAPYPPIASAPGAG